MKQGIWLYIHIMNLAQYLSDGNSLTQVILFQTVKPSAMLYAKQLQRAR